MADKEKKLNEKIMEFEAIKTESDAAIQELRDSNEEFKSANERLVTANEALEKERNELRSNLDEKMQQSQRLEESLRESLMHKSAKSGNNNN